MSQFGKPKSDTLDFWVKFAKQYSLSSLVTVIPDPQLRALVGEATLEGEKDSGKALNAQFRNFLGTLSSPHFTLPDYGAWLLEQLTSGSGSWKLNAVLDAGLAYPRPGVVIDSKRKSSLFGANFGAYGLGAVHCKCIEQLVRALDMPVLGINVLSVMTKAGANPLLEGRDPTERPIGELIRMRAVLSDLISIMYLQVIQSVVYDARWHYPFLKRCSNALRKKKNVNRELLLKDQEYIESLEKVMKLPLHQILAYAAHGPSTAQAIGLFGKKKCSIVSGAKGLPEVDIIKAFSKSTPDVSFDMLMAYENVLMLGAQQAASVIGKATKSNTAVENVGRLRTRTTWSEFASSDKLWDWREIAIAISEGGFDGIIQIVAGKLGWSAAPAEDWSPLDFWGSQFAMTDGDTYTQTYATVLAGLTPVLALNNRFAFGANAVLLHQWNTTPQSDKYGGQITYCTATVAGRFNSPIAERIEEHTITSGEWMGELHAQVMWLPPDPTAAVSDPVVASLYTYFDAKSSVGFLNRWVDGVPRPAPAPPKGKPVVPGALLPLPDSVRWPDWMPWAQASVPTMNDEKVRELLTDWKAVWGNDLTPAQTTTFMVSDDGFRQRFPLAVEWGTRTKELYYYNSSGLVYGRTEFHGVQYRDGHSAESLDWSHTPAKYEKMISDMVSMWRSTGAGGVIDTEIGETQPFLEPSVTFSGVELND
jgi:hypothetical protein